MVLQLYSLENKSLLSIIVPSLLSRPRSIAPSLLLHLGLYALLISEVKLPVAADEGEAGFAADCMVIFSPRYLSVMAMLLPKVGLFL